MILALLEIMLGKVGRAFLEFYREYSPFINAAAVLYGCVLVYAHSNLRSAVRRMEAIILEIARGFGAQADVKLVHSRFTTRWKEEQATHTTLIPSRRDLWLTRVPSDSLPELLHVRPDYIRMVMHKELGDPPIRSFKPAVFRAWEHHRHQLLTGMRGGARNPDEMIAALETRIQEQQARAAKTGKKR